MSFPFEITRDDIRDYCCTRYFSTDSGDFYVSTGPKASVIVWSGFAQILGGPALTESILACEKSLYPLKDLCLRIVSESVASNPDQILTAIEIAKITGKEIGRNECQKEIKIALGIKVFDF